MFAWIIDRRPSGVCVISSTRRRARPDGGTSFPPGPYVRDGSLNGSLAKWQEAGLPVAKEPTPAPKDGSFKITRTNEDVRATLPEVLTASGDPAGQIPDGILLPSADLYNADETFESPDELRRMLRSLNIRPDQHEAREE